MGSPIRTTERKLHLCRAAWPLLCHLLGKPADSSQLVLASGLWLFDARYLNLSDAAAHRFRQLAFSHCLTQPVVHECGFQTNAKRPVQLVAADPFLAVAHQEGALEPDVQYRWYISATRNPNSPSQDIVAGGVIERCEFSTCLVEMEVDLTCDRQSVLRNALRGFWYDAMACVCELIDANPSDQTLRRQRAALLNQIGLSGVAEWDLRSIQAPAR